MSASIGSSSTRARKASLRPCWAATREGTSFGGRHQPEPGLVRLEQRSREVDDLAEDRREVERPGELLRDRSQRSRALELTLGPAEEPRARQRRRHHRRQRAPEFARQPGGRTIVEHEQADRSALRGKRDRHVGSVGIDGAGDGWRFVEPGVRGELEGLDLADVDRRAVDAELRAQGLDDRSGDRRRRRRRGEAGGDAAEDGELAAAFLRRIELRDRVVVGGTILDEQPLDVSTSEASVTARVDPVGGEPSCIGPGANRVRMHAEDRRRLGDRQKRGGVIPRHRPTSPGLTRPRRTGRMELLVRTVHPMLETGCRVRDAPFVPGGGGRRPRRRPRAALRLRRSTPALRRPQCRRHPPRRPSDSGRPGVASRRRGPGC